MPRQSKRALREAQPFTISPELEPLMRPIDDAHEYVGNARRGDIAFIRQSLRKNGLYRAPIARRETGEVLVNNHVVKAAREMGATALPYDWRSIESDDDARAIVLADNAASDRGKYDQEALTALVAAAAKSTRGLEGTGYDRDALAGLLNRHAPEIPTPDPDPIARPAKPKTKRGQLLELGRHRLLCADSTDPDAIAKVLAGDQADMIWTDPPYGVDLGPLAAKRGRDHGDMASDGDLAAALDTATRALSNAHPHLRGGGACYLAHPDTHGAAFREAYERAGFQLRQVLIRIKDSLVLGRQDYQWRHEPILYGWKSQSRGGHRWFGHFDKTTVIDGASRAALEALEHEDLVEIAWRLLEGEPGSIVRLAKPRVAEHHPTSKPTKLVAGHIANSAPAGGLVLDPFGGSGSTLVAAEQTGRRAALVELDPGYCDVIRQRHEDMHE